MPGALSFYVPTFFFQTFADSDGGRPQKKSRLLTTTRAARRNIFAQQLEKTFVRGYTEMYIWSCFSSNEIK